MILLTISTPVTAQVDSTVCIPKAQALEIISDLERGDECEEKAAVKDSTINILEVKIEKKDSIIIELRKIEDSYKEEIQTREEKSLTQDLQLNLANKKIKKIMTQKNLIIIGGCVVSVGLIVGVIALAL